MKWRVNRTNPLTNETENGSWFDDLEIAESLKRTSDVISPKIIHEIESSEDLSDDDIYDEEL